MVVEEFSVMKSFEWLHFRSLLYAWNKLKQETLILTQSYIYVAAELCWNSKQLRSEESEEWNDEMSKLPSGSLYGADKEREESRCDLDNILSPERRFKWKFHSYLIRLFFC